MTKLERAQPLICSAAATLFLGRATAAFLGIGIQLLLARLLGAEQLGHFYLATSLVAICAVVAVAGYPNVVLKIVTHRRHAVRRASCLARVAIVDGCAATVLVGTVLLAVGIHPLTQGVPVLICALALPALAFARILNAFSVAGGHPLIANLPDLLVRPAAMGLGMLMLLHLGLPLSAASASWMYVASASVTTVLMALAIARAGAVPPPARVVDRRLRNKFRRTAFPLTTVSLLSVFFGDLAILASGLFLLPADLGVFALVLKISLLVGFSVQAIHQIHLPRLAAGYSHKISPDAQVMIGDINRAAVFLTAAGALVIGSSGPRILPLFGEEFAVGSGALMLLVGVQVVRACFGPSVQALALVSAHRTSALLSLSAGLLLLLGCTVLVPNHGIYGAASATGIAMLFWFGAASHFAAKSGFATTGFGISAGTEALRRTIARWWST